MMVISHDSVHDPVKKIFDFQKNKSLELKRPVTYYEALALWFSETVVNKKNKPEKSKQPVI
jgi:hypothetical protein